MPPRRVSSLVGRVKAVAPVTVPVAPVVEAKPEKPTLPLILFGVLQDKFTPEQIDYMAAVIDPSISPDALLNMLAYIRTVTYPEALEYLGSIAGQTSKELIWSNPLLKKQQMKQRIDMEIIRSKPETGAGEECPHCHGKNTISAEKQVRSADEPMTIKFTCLDCSTRWKRG